MMYSIKAGILQASLTIYQVKSQCTKMCNVFTWIFVSESCDLGYLLQRPTCLAAPTHIFCCWDGALHVSSNHLQLTVRSKEKHRESNTDMTTTSATPILWLEMHPRCLWGSVVPAECTYSGACLGEIMVVYYLSLSGGWGACSGPMQRTTVRSPKAMVQSWKTTVKTKMDEYSGNHWRPWNSAKDSRPCSSLLQKEEMVRPHS